MVSIPALWPMRQPRYQLRFLLGCISFICHHASVQVQLHYQGKYKLKRWQPTGDASLQLPCIGPLIRSSGATGIACLWVWLVRKRWFDSFQPHVLGMLYNMCLNPFSALQRLIAWLCTVVCSPKPL